MADDRQYLDGNPSSIGTQLNSFHYERRALIELKKERPFSMMSSTTKMPKHHGKKIKKYLYVPILDERNINDQGLDAAGVKTAEGNLYGSSKDVGQITGKLPALTENGGQVNRVGMTRLEIEGNLEKYGIYRTYTKESVDFDTDADLEMHAYREMLRAANEINEDLIQLDLLLSAGAHKRYGGAATSMSTITGEGSTPSLISYSDIQRINIDLDNNRTPKHTKIISGSLMTDTKTLPACRICYVGSELQPSLERMVDLFDAPAFIPVNKYANATEIMDNEIGAVGQLRFVVVQEMMNWSAKGAEATAANLGYRTAVSTAASDGIDTGTERYNVYPMLIIGSEAFTTIGFETDGKNSKLRIKHRKPESENSYSDTDPYGEKGFMSIKWYYGILFDRPERIAVLMTIAEI